MQLVECVSKHGVFGVKINPGTSEFFSKPAPANFQAKIMIGNISHTAAPCHPVCRFIDYGKWPPCARCLVCKCSIHPFLQMIFVGKVKGEIIPHSFILCKVKKCIKICF